MARRSAFAQKLLDDLRLRKERTAASQSSKGTNPMVADAYAYSKTSYKSSRESKTLKTTGFRAGSTQKMASGGRKSDTTEKVSNQIVPFGRGQKSEQIGNLSMALAFAIENGGKLRAESSGKSSIFSFLHSMGRKQMGHRKMERRNSSVNSHQPSSSQLPTLSHLHIEEISRGVQKLNQILKACSNGLNFDRYSIEIGRELLKGARDLEESLGTLVKLQEDSEYMIRPQRKSRITLLEEDEDDDENTVKIVDQMQLGRPRFSNYNDFQEVARTDLRLRLAALTYSSDVSDSKHKNDVLVSSNSHSHKRSVSYVPDTKSNTAFSEQSHSSSVHFKQGKSRISNVITKLMGLDEHPRNIDSKVATKVAGNQKVVGVVTKTPAKDTKKAEQGTKDSAALAHHLPPVKEKATTVSKTPLTQDKVTAQVGKTLTTRNGSTRVAAHDKLPPQKKFKDNKAVTSLRKALIKVDKQQGDIAHLNLNSGNRKEIQEKESEQNSIKYREKKGIERIDIKKPVLILKDGMQHMIPHVHKTSEFALTLQEKPEYSECIPQRESRHANKLLLGNQKKLQSSHGFQELRGKKQQSELKEEQSTEQKLQRKKQKGNELFSKPMSGATNLQKKQPQMKQAETSRKGPSKHIDVTKLNGFPDGRHHQNLARTGSSKIKGSLDRNSGHHYTQGVIESESAKDQNLFAVDEKPVQGQKTMKARTINVYKHEFHFTRYGKGKAGETCYLKRSRSKENQQQISSVEAQKNSILCSPLEDGCQSLNGLQALAWRESVRSLNQLSDEATFCQNSVPLVTKEQQDQEPDFDKAEELKFKNNISEPLHGIREESREIPCTPQSQHQRTCDSEMPEPLTESENHPKEILTKRRLFMNTAEALFKLNILHTNGHNHQDQESKLVLDCGYEVMKSKGIRQELSVHPFLKVTIISNKEKTLDELVKQMCEDIDKLKLYRRGRRENSPFEDYLPKMLESDVNNKEPRLNCLWDMGWNSMMFAFLEKDDVVRDAEKYVLNGLLDEMTRDLFTCVSVSV
ncbi:hypothetical protein CXB51_011469 [Gossypium anomalum]|uniref:DUF3741 domain-containing protein n=1 Tax=Gossypium anomalum TaxID=47600 RepID=A0A8J5Z492_9ROSI|nr:hypothetical protein CXB51_011469 [Gossypium anomalum]